MLATCLLEILHDISYAIMSTAQSRNESDAIASAQAFSTLDASQLRTRVVCPDAPLAIDPSVYL